MDDDSNARDFTGLLQLAQDGDADAESQLFEMIEQELRDIATRMSGVGRHRGTSLVNEAYVYLFRRIKVKKDLDLRNRRYFFTAIADRMRKVLLDRLKRRTPGRWDAALDDALFSFESSTSWDYERLHRVLSGFLESDDPRTRRRHQLINLHFFAGMTYKAAADELGISITQYQIDRDRALAELQRAMNSDAT